MYTLLVVDDEKYAVQGISRGIEWEDLQIDRIFEAYDSNEAMVLLQNNHVDVMITDVEMPGVNGIELLEWVKLNSAHTVTIFLTGHAEFSYAQKAVHLGSLDYLLKPIDHDQLKKMVCTAIGKVEKEQDMQGFSVLYQKYLKRWEAYLPKLIENFWMDIIGGRMSLAQEKLEFLISQYKIPLDIKDAIIPILISIESWKDDLSTKDEEVMTFAVQNAAADILLDEFAGSIIHDYYGTVLVLVYNSSEKRTENTQLLNLYKEKCQQFIETCNQYFYSVVSCYIGEPSDIFHLGENCPKLLDMENGNVKSRQKVFCHFEVEEKENQLQSIPWFPEWALLFEMGKKDELMNRVMKLFSNLEADEHVSRESLQEIFHGINYMILRAAHKNDLKVNKQSENITGDEVIRSVSRLKRWAIQTLSELNYDTKEESVIIDKVKQYILEHICEEFSREDIAKKVYLNPAYLSRVFKNETGLSLSDYIAKVRMELAKKMLSESNITISAVAEKVGYCNFSHFTKMFKRFIGITPSNYRKNFKDERDSNDSETEPRKKAPVSANGGHYENDYNC